MTLFSFSSEPRKSTSALAEVEYYWVENDACWELVNVRLVDGVRDDVTLDWVREMVTEGRPVEVDEARPEAGDTLYIRGRAWSERLDSHDFGTDYDGGFEVESVHQEDAKPEG